MNKLLPSDWWSVPFPPRTMRHWWRGTYPGRAFARAMLPSQVALGLSART
jgi:hypothetical protein